MSDQPAGTDAAGDGGKVEVTEPAQGVALVTISNPAKRGALDSPLLERLTATFEALDARCVVITGEGKAFCSGYDVGELLAGRYDPSPGSGHPLPTALAAIESYPYPVVAALNGHTIGGGLELAIACDLRIAADTALLGMPPAKLGVVYPTAGLNRFLATVGAARTRELFFTGRRIDAATAERWGLVNQVVEADALQPTVLELATEIAANAPLSLRGNKAAIRALVAAGGELDPATAAALDEQCRAAFASEDLREGLRAFSEKRAPVWRGR